MPYSIFQMSDRFILLAILFLLSTTVLAVDTNISVDAEKKVSIEKLQLSTKMQALLDAISTPEAALEESRKYQENGQFGLAKIVLQHGIDLAKSSGSDVEALQTELEYSMPILQAREQLVLGNPEEAENILTGLTEKFGSDYRRNIEINALKEALVPSKLLAASKRNNERDVTRDVRKRLSQYYDKHGAFPVFAELNKILPPDDKVLQNYEIVYFKAVPNAYRLVLRNIHNKENFLKIEATGLIK
ncbi:MAG: hypothetical protein KAJ95_06890 [Gammaproteobacteria bacterium]|nr:hypothetical protein [Gammaproteobacteria bacterium]